ncbi:hypothetical protein AAFF_G00347480 [Aldrovandia affinis]|uniref:Uncharacterized protein n=1 Tax=Aldrovandia affinis TaxID=143900 RepID=A0AAD7SJN0_9TELE|nr:hypothetical protein AAFF_G00347480 [Aldrovandia affinis]
MSLLRLEKAQRSSAVLRNARSALVEKRSQGSAEVGGATLPHGCAVSCERSEVVLCCRPVDAMSRVEAAGLCCVM